MKIKKGDNVKILAGKDRSKIGKVVNVYPKIDKITVDGLNLYKKHVRPKREGEKGQIIQVSRPLVVSNVILICQNCKKPVRAGYRFDDNRKVRYCRKCKNIL